MIQVTAAPPDMIYSGVVDVQGGKMITIQLTDDVVSTIRWAQKYKENLQREIELRESNPALASQWDQYQTMLRIVMDDV